MYIVFIIIKLFYIPQAFRIQTCKPCLNYMFLSGLRNPVRATFNPRLFNTRQREVLNKTSRCRLSQRLVYIYEI